MHFSFSVTLHVSDFPTRAVYEIIQTKFCALFKTLFCPKTAPTVSGGPGPKGRSTLKKCLNMKSKSDKTYKYLKIFMGINVLISIIANQSGDLHGPVEDPEAYTR